MISVQRARDLGRRLSGRRWGRRDGRLAKAGRAVMRPFGLALFQGDADPPPASRRPTFRVPRRLAVLLPSQTFDLVQVAELALSLILFGTTQGMLTEAIAAHTEGYPVPEWIAYLAGLAVALPLVLRDRWPLAAWRVAIVQTPLTIWAAITLDLVDPPYSAQLSVMYLMVLYSVAVRCDKQITLAVWIITVLTVWIADPNSMALVAVMASVVVLFGYNVRTRRAATARLVEEERRTQVAESAQAVLAERARIARELHDVVAHHMSVIAIQAEAVPLKAAGDPAQLEAGLAEIRGLSLAAIAELRQVLGVLRDQDGRTDTAPQPGLDRLDELVVNARAAGLAVVVERDGPLDGLPPAVGLSAYRIVQESLSNAMRHAPGAAVAVSVAWDDGELRLRVANGPGTAPGDAPGAGQGLVGMRERATLLGGTLEAGPLPGGGFDVRATLPIADAMTEEGA
ncbi:sensor histidine kinase [Nonomuraea turkmeniaca]|uniref:histidine kinase n=1 Tax=Nonomuraea turkmeniaca TaxID=103838 RepID=A0A5S4F6Y1_9ACTN|nr:sensor histidine kinase [Nonomuraea turkmeniaca]TMR11816.1 sensor histidine kinase [Nonomuraea turkmeniaca]